MQKYYTKVCNFYYGSDSKIKVKKKLSLPLNGNNFISFDSLEILSRNSKKKIHIKEIKKQSKKLRKKIYFDLKKITKKKKFKKLHLSSFPILMGILNLTPDSFSDGGLYNNKKLSYKYAKNLVKAGCKILDIGGESTRPGAKDISKNIEWMSIESAEVTKHAINAFLATSIVFSNEIASNEMEIRLVKGSDSGGDPKISVSTLTNKGPKLVRCFTVEITSNGLRFYGFKTPENSLFYRVRLIYFINR